MNSITQLPYKRLLTIIEFIIQLQPTLDKVFAYRVSVHRFQEVGRPMKHVLDARAFFRGLGRWDSAVFCQSSDPALASFLSRTTFRANVYQFRHLFNIIILWLWFRWGIHLLLFLYFIMLSSFSPIFKFFTSQQIFLNFCNTFLHRN